MMQRPVGAHKYGIKYCAHVINFELCTPSGPQNKLNNLFNRQHRRQHYNICTPSIIRGPTYPGHRGGLVSNTRRKSEHVFFWPSPPAYARARTHSKLLCYGRKLCRKNRKCTRMFGERRWRWLRVSRLTPVTDQHHNKKNGFAAPRVHFLGPGIYFRFRF